MPDDVLDMIGTAAALEQLAEESAELAQAALKTARKLRGENPTPKSRADCVANCKRKSRMWSCASVFYPPRCMTPPRSARRWLQSIGGGMNGYTMKSCGRLTAMRIDIRDSKYSIIYNEKTGAVEDVLWCNESAEDLKSLNVVADMARELAVYRQAGTAMIAGAQRLAYSRGPEKYSFSVPSERHRHLHTVDRTDAVALLMQAGSLALGEMDALRECKAKTAAANLYRAMIGF